MGCAVDMLTDVRRCDARRHACASSRRHLFVTEPHLLQVVRNQEEELKQAKLQIAQLELGSAQLRSQAAHSQRVEAKSPQQVPPEVPPDSGDQAHDVEHGSEEMIKAHHPFSPKVRCFAFALLRVSERLQVSHICCTHTQDRHGVQATVSSCTLPEQCYLSYLTKPTCRCYSH